jgi:hypothetical protein
MNWNSFNTYGNSYEDAFECLCTQLFEHYLWRKYPNKIEKYRTINGSGGDGGIEAYAQVDDSIIGLQAKWFRTALNSGQIKQIKNSILTAKANRPAISNYIICIPKNVNSIKNVRGDRKKINDEESKIQSLIDEVKGHFPDLKIEWWFQDRLLKELQLSCNDGIYRYWFEKEVISINQLKRKFQLQKVNSWL